MKTVIITGISEGLGFELGKLFLEKGYRVVGISRKIPNLKVSHIQADLTKKSDIEKVIKEVKGNYKNFDSLLNVAGTLSVKPLDKIDYDEMELLFKLNVLAPIALTSGLIDLIKQNEADIVNVGSTIGFKSYENQLAYTASKWAIRGVNTNLQLELKGTKSRVLGFNPGGFESKIFEKATGIPLAENSGLMKPSELAKLLVSFLELPKNMEVSEIIVNRK